MEPFGIALIGCGTVGTGVARLLLEHGDRLSARADRPLALRKVVVREPGRQRGVKLPAGLVTTDLGAVLNDPAIHLAVELVGGTGFAREAVLRLLEAGKDIVTANKALLAQHGMEVFEAARRNKRAIAFEASVAGGIPIIAALAQGLAANQILSLQGIVNGTCNFILTQMSDEGQAYAEALAEAQRLGYAEADPTLDVDGSDAVHKLAVLAQVAFGTTVAPSLISKRGIADIQDIDMRFTTELGYTIKLLAEAWRNGGELALHVSPVLVHQRSPLALVRGAYNAIYVVGDAVGDTLHYGRGAGQMPTASAVVADIIDMAIGRAQKTFQASRFWSEKADHLKIRPSDTVKSRFYLRTLVRDQPGVLAEIARELAQEQVSISSVIQHEAPEDHEGDQVALVIMTHTALTGAFRAALERINRLSCVAAPSVYYPVAD